MRKQRVDQTIVVRESPGVYLAAALRQHAAPRDAEAVCVHAEPPHQCHVFGVAAILVACDVAAVAVAHEPRRVRETMPDARPGAVGERRSFDLVGGGGAAPQKILGKLDCALAGGRHDRAGREA